MDDPRFWEKVSMARLWLGRRAFIATSLGTGLAAAGCTTTTPQPTGNTPQVNQSRREEIDAAVSAALERLYRQAPDSRQLVQQAKGTLVFPNVVKAGFILGGQYGDGALRVRGRTINYYSAAGGSIGALAGAQEISIFILFMTDDALQKFQESSGWQVGADASVALINVGAAGSVSSQTARQPVVGYVLTQGGLMVDLSLSGTKISKLNI
jgi:lipid-binding SYLF domain-containing protein